MRSSRGHPGRGKITVVHSAYRSNLQGARGKRGEANVTVVNVPDCRAGPRLGDAMEGRRQKQRAECQDLLWVVQEACPQPRACGDWPVWLLPERSTKPRELVRGERVMFYQQALLCALAPSPMLHVPCMLVSPRLRPVLLINPRLLPRASAPEP